MSDDAPEPDSGLADALQLTDTLEQGAPIAMPEASKRGFRLLAGIGAALRRTAVSASEPGALFTWGGLEVRRRIGEGRFGEVYAAWDRQLQREVALKLRRPEAGTLRWLDEARSLARVQHPNVVTIHGADLQGGRAGLWMELIDGESLEGVLARTGPLEVGEALRIGRDLASALDAVHRAGLVHGDLKAGNVTIERGHEPGGGAMAPAGAAPANAERRGAPAAAGAPATPRRVVLMDFGAASASLAAQAGALPRYATPLYAAPELLAGGTASAATDVYALGVLLHRLLTGAHPYEAASVAELIAAHTRGGRVPLARRRRGLPARVVRVVERALAERPAERYGGAAALRDDLARALGEHVPRVPPRVVAIAAFGVVSLAAAGFFARGELARMDTDHYVLPPPPTLAMERSPWWWTPGDSLYAERGFSTAAADLDGDGRPEAIVSDLTLGDAGYTARALIYSITRGGLARTPSQVVVAPNEYQRTCRVACGDINGDGHPDLMMFWSSGHHPGGGTGGGVLYLGTPHGVSEQPAWRYTAERVYTAFGEDAEVVGDVNGDGYVDVMVGEHDWTGERRNQGRVLLFLGGPRGLSPQPAQVLTDEPQSQRFGQVVCGVGDLNHDGYADVAVGAPLHTRAGGDVGLVQIYLGGPRGLHRAPHGRIEGGRGDELGYLSTITAAGDVNGDGYGDVVIGAPLHSGEGENTGQVSLYLGGPDGLRTPAVWHADGFGSGAMSGFSLQVGDVNGDGRPDLVVGARGFARSPKTKEAGAVLVYLGAGPRRYFEPRPAWWAWSGQADAQLGNSITLADFDGDGCADILTGAPLWRIGASVTGREMIYRGSRARTPGAAAGR